MVRDASNPRPHPCSRVCRAISRSPEYGAKGDGQTDSTAAIAQAIAECSRAGGGRVVVPGGVYSTGAIHLLSNVNLHVAADATLLFNQDPARYLPSGGHAL